MARSAITLAMNFATDAAFRAMVQAIDAGIQAMGWTRTADTGQMNTATVLAPTGSNQDRGYMMWQATDALAGTYPMMFRLNLGSAGSPTTLRWRFKVGYATDGAGNFTGVSNSWDYTDRDGPVSNATAYDCFFSGDTNRIAVALFDNYSGTSNIIYFSVERSHDATGADTNLGIAAWASQGQQNNAQNFLPYVGTGNGANNKIIGAHPTTTGTLIGTQVGLFPIYPLYVVLLNPSVQWLTFITSEITANTVITCSMYGSTMSWLTTRAARGANDQNRLAMRWDL